MSRLTIDLPSHVPADEARLLLSMKLYGAECISLGKAAELAGYSKRASMGNVSRFPTVEKDSARVPELTRRRP